MTKDQGLGLKSWLTGPGKKEDKPEGKPAKPVPLNKHRLAVLPFVNLSPAQDDEYFADGLTEEMISALSGIGGLNIISRTSMMSFKGTREKVSEIGKELSAGSVVEGSVRRVGNRIRITVQHIETKTDRNLWSQTYDRELDDIFAVQSDIAKQVAEKLRVKIQPRERRIIEKEPTRSPEAHLLYLKGRQYWNERSKEALVKAIEHFEKAVALDPGFALAYSGLADCYDAMIGFSFMTRDEALPKLEQYAMKAVQLDELSAEAHTSLAAVMMEKLDWMAAERELKRAMDLNPSYSSAHADYARFLSIFRKFDEALKEALMAEQLDPLSPRFPNLCARLFLDMDQVELAEEKVKRAFRIQPDYRPALFTIFIVHRRQGNWEECNKDLDKMESFRDNNFGKALRGVVLVGLGRLEEARTILRQISEAYAYEPQFENAAHIDLCLALGEHEKAVQLVLATYWRSHTIMSVIASSPLFESLRQDPRVQEVLRKVGLLP